MGVIFRNAWRHPRKTAWQFMTRLDTNEYSRFTFFRTPWFEVFFHRVFCADPSPFAHTHPWSFVSILLWGSYHEIRLSPRRGWRIRRRAWLNVLHFKTPHRIFRTSGFVSICIALPREPEVELHEITEGLHP